MLLVKFCILRIEISLCEVENVVNFMCSVNPFAGQVTYYLVGLGKVTSCEGSRYTIFLVEHFR